MKGTGKTELSSAVLYGIFTKGNKRDFALEYMDEYLCQTQQELW